MPPTAVPPDLLVVAEGFGLTIASAPRDGAGRAWRSPQPHPRSTSDKEHMHTRIALGAGSLYLTVIVGVFLIASTWLVRRPAPAVA
jgi:hypothetical protein